MFSNKAFRTWQPVTITVLALKGFTLVPELVLAYWGFPIDRHVTCQRTLGPVK